MSHGGLHHRSYEWRGETEWLTEIGEGRAILFVPPLFEEMNRCRAFIVAAMRVVAEAGFRAVMPDLPGTGESPRELSDARWEDWTGVVSMLSTDLSPVDQAPLSISFRGGCLLGSMLGTAHLWRFAPVAGNALARDLVRAKQASASTKINAQDIDREARTGGAEFAGYHVPAALFSALGDAPAPGAEARTVRLASDPADAAVKVEGRPLWRQAEPGVDPELSRTLGRDIARWAGACAD